MRKTAGLGVAFLGSCILLSFAAPAVAQADSDQPVEEIGKLRAKVKRAADRPYWRQY